VLQKLKDYKEVIALIVFFLGGFTWIQKNFPDKTYLDDRIKAQGSKIATLECLLSHNINATDAQLKMKIHSDDIEKFRARSATLNHKSPATLSEDEKNELDELKRSIENARDDLQKEQNRSDAILSDFKAGKCNNV
jgi:hypothetical protein